MLPYSHSPLLHSYTHKDKVVKKITADQSEHRKEENDYLRKKHTEPQKTKITLWSASLQFFWRRELCMASCPFWNELVPPAPRKKNCSTIMVSVTEQ